MNTYPFAGEIKMFKVIKDGQEVIEWEQVKTTKLDASAPEWARVDKDLNVTHLDMELCAQGPQNAYTALAMAIWNKAIETEREKVAAWMMAQGYATGHGDTVEDLLKELEWQIRESEREVCARSLDKQADLAGDPMDREWAQEMAAAVRARGEQ